MRKRNIDKHIWFSKAEAQELQKKAKTIYMVILKNYFVTINVIFATAHFSHQNCTNIN